MTNTLQTNVTLTDVTFDLLRADGGKDKERDLARRHRAEKKSARRVIDEVLSRRPMWLTM